MDFYLEEPRLRKKKNPKLEVISWWKEKYNQFPELSLMSQVLISITITIVASESSFSTIKKKKKPFTQYQICLLPKNVDATLCTKSWLCGFEGNLTYLC